MISKVFPGHSFYHAGRYVCEKKGAELLDSFGVRAFDPKLMAEDFAAQSDLRTSKKKACFHAALSFYPGEKPSNEALAKIAREYLEGLGIVNTQYAIVKHTDRAHLHLHVLANLIDNDGNPIKDGWIGLRGKKVAQELTKKYNLIPAEGKNLDLTHLEALSQSEANRYYIYKAIVGNLPRCRTLADLARCLMSKGIHTQFKYKGETQELQGISFKIGNDCFKGSQIDRKFSIANLQKALVSSRQKREIKPRLSPKDRRKGLAFISESTRSTESALSQPSESRPINITPMLAALLKHEQETSGGPDGLTEEERKRRRRNRGLGR